MCNARSQTAYERTPALVGVNCVLIRLCEEKVEQVIEKMREE